MTRREYMMIHYPDRVNDAWTGGVMGCPAGYVGSKIFVVPEDFADSFITSCDYEERCYDCWNKETCG